MNLPFAMRHAYIFTALMVVSIFIAGGISAVIPDTDQPELIAVIVRCGLLTILIAVLLTRWEWWRQVGFRTPRRNRDLLYFLVPFIPVVLNLIPGSVVGNPADLLQLLATAYSHPSDLLLVLVASLLVSFAQEGIFRGVMLQAILPHGVWKAVIITALLFGLIHFAGLFQQSATATVLQVSYLLATGFMFAALVVRKGIIWPLILAHFLTDFTGFPNPNAAGTVASIPVDAGMIAVFLAYGFFVMMDGAHKVETRAPVVGVR
ncbi:MAG TPA: type II CAAX endopeptidase family protein [Rhodanobacteraceae bacterium]